MKPRIYCDIDGVLADFVGAASAFHGLGLTHENYPQGVWDFVAHFGLDPKTFWEPLGYDFWRTIPKTADFEWLKEFLEGGDAEVYLLSSPCLTKGCLDGKRDWVAEHWPEMERRLILTSAKDAIAGPWRLLIDDSEANCRKWEDAGGMTVLFPQPWNWRMSGPDRRSKRDRVEWFCDRFLENMKEW